MPSGGPFPTTDAELNNYFRQATDYLMNNLVRLGISAPHQQEVGFAMQEWTDVYPLATNANTRTATVTSRKNAARDRLLQALRAAYTDIPASVLTLEDRAVLNLKARGAATPTPVPASRPVGRADTSERLRHTIYFSDEATPQSKAKPPRVRGCQIWFKIGGDAPADPKDLRYLVTDTASPYVVNYEGADAGKPVYYWLRWENTVGECGPWSETIVATITG